MTYIYFIYNPFIEKNFKRWTQRYACLPTLSPEEATYTVQGHNFIQQLFIHCCWLSQIAKLGRDFGEM